MKRKLCELILIVIFYLLQVTLGRAIEIGSIAPNFLIILPVLLGFLCGKDEGIYVGLVSGLMYDVFFGNVGFSSIVFMYIGYISGLFYQKYEENEMLIPLAILAVSNFAYGFISCVGNFLLHNKLDMVYYLSRFVFPELVYTVLITIILYKPLVFASSRFESKDKRRSKNFD